MAGGGTRLLTSAGKYGAMVTDIRLTFDRPGGTLIGGKGEFVIVQGEPIQTRAADRAAGPIAPRLSGRSGGGGVVERYRAAAAERGQSPGRPARRAG